MIKHITAAVAAATVLAGAAQAAVLDFALEADTNGERGLNSGDFITIDGLTVQLITSNDEDSPYLDANVAGLGVCKVLDMANQCTPSNDDNVTEGEGIGIVFSEPMNITSLTFRDAAHNLLGVPGNDGLVQLFGNDQIGVGTFLFSELIAMAASGSALFTQTNFLGFIFEDTQFYVSSVTAEVPLPGALPLLISGLAGLGLASRKKKAA